MREDWCSGPSPTWQFPNGTLFKKREGEVITVGEKQFLITRDMHESFLQGIEQWKVVFEGVDLQISEPVVIKFRYVLDQHAIDPDIRGLRYRIIEHYSAEVESLQSCYGCEYFPKYIAHEEKQQSKEEPNPGAPVYIVVMSKIDALPLIAPGTRPTDIFSGSLTAEDKQIIRRHSLEALEALRQRGLPPFITLYKAYYNIRTKMLYFLGHSIMNRNSKFSTPGPVTESSRDFYLLIDVLDREERSMAQQEILFPRDELEEKRARLRLRLAKEWMDLGESQIPQDELEEKLARLRLRLTQEWFGTDYTPL